MVRDSVGHEFSGQGGRVGFHVVAYVATLHIVHHVAAHPYLKLQVTSSVVFHQLGLPEIG